MGLAVARSSETPGFSLALTTYADPAAMRDWVAQAAPGHELVYATGPALGDHPAKRTALDLQQSGQVVLFQRRATRAHCFEYCAKRVHAEACPAPVPAEKVDHTRAQLSALLRELRRCAAKGEVCPSLSAAAKVLDLPRGQRGRRRAQYLFDRLVAEKRIAIASHGRNAPRVATILAAGRAQGKSTRGDKA